MKFRNLSTEEIDQLEKSGCVCNDWSLIKVKQGFSTRNIRNVIFSGNVSIGLLQKAFTLSLIHI